MESKAARWSDQPQIRRLFAKLCLRKLKRKSGLEVFDVDSVYARLARGVEAMPAAHTSAPEDEAAPNAIFASENILDRYQNQDNKRSTSELDVDSLEEQPFCSPYTHKKLKPRIWKDTEARPMRMKLLHEIKSKFNQTLAAEDCCIEYSYLRRHHVSQVNKLCQDYFWPGIDCSDALHYPDFTCVALYKRLVVGFAAAVPDVSCSEAYVSFLLTRHEWRGAGLASFMLYHLAKKLQGKDLCLHVSADNPAVFLYHKFGFKTEQLLLDFYDKYYPTNWAACKHALKMRLNR